MHCLVERFLQRSGGFLLRKCPYLLGKIHIYLSRYEKNIASKWIFQNDHYFFLGIMRSELNYAISHRRIIPEALEMT